MAFIFPLRLNISWGGKDERDISRVSSFSMSLERFNISGPDIPLCVKRREPSLFVFLYFKRTFSTVIPSSLPRSSLVLNPQRAGRAGIILWPSFDIRGKAFPSDPV